MDAEEQLCDLDWSITQRTSPPAPDSTAWREAETAYLERRREIEAKQEVIARRRIRAAARDKIISHSNSCSTPALRAAYFELLLSMYEKTSRRSQPGFAKDIMENYGTKKEADGKHSLVWCPSFGEWVVRESRIAAHLFPLSLGQSTMTYIFGPDSKGEINSAKNGLFLPKRMEDAFDDHQLVIVPAENAPPSQVREWRYLVVERNLLDVAIEGKTKFRDLHNQNLQFQPGNSFRPRPRYLYFHYILSMLLLNKAKVRGVTPGAIPDLQAPELTRAWGTKKRYLRANVMVAFIEAIGHDLPGADEMLDGTDTDISSHDTKGLVESVQKLELESEDEGGDE
jgi:hypothetical protein